MEKLFGMQSFDPETENSHSRTSGTGKTYCYGFNLIMSREKDGQYLWSRKRYAKSRGGKSCVAEGILTQGTVMVCTIRLDGNSHNISIPMVRLGRKQGLLSVVFIRSAVTL